MPSLTAHLQTLSPQTFEAATTHPFLLAAAKSTLPRAKLIHWLAQDRMYALSYVAFIGNLLGGLQLSDGISVLETEDKNDKVDEKRSRGNVEWKVAEGLIDCLVNIKREIRMFEQTAKEEGFLEEILKAKEEDATRKYRDCFRDASQRGRPSIVGMVVLWASEVCYLNAWRFAAKHLEERSEGEEGDVMQRVFIPNWSSGEFEEFVEGLGDLVDLMGERVEEGGAVWRECEEGWKGVVECEVGFWPEV